MKRKSFPGLSVLLVLCLGISAGAQEQKKIKTGLWPEDWKYTLAEGVTSKEVTYDSEGVACYGKIFFPKGFSNSGKIPGIVLGQGWGGWHYSIENTQPDSPSAAWSPWR